MSQGQKHGVKVDTGVLHPVPISSLTLPRRPCCCCLCCRFRKDCELLAGFVHRIEHFITETEDDTDMTGPGWEAAFSVSDWTAATAAAAVNA
jgi:hypothetical protein